jgi:hypothetical protein
MSQELDLFQPAAPAKSPTKKPRKLSNHQKVIQRFVTVTFSSRAKGFWPNEMRIAGQLIQKYTIDFLLWCSPPNNYKVTSLVWFLTPEGHHYLSDQLVEYSKQKAGLFEERKETSLEANKIGEDVVIQQPKPRTLKEFLNYGKTVARYREEEARTNQAARPDAGLLGEQ